MSGNCSAGYYCKSGAREDMPSATDDFTACPADSECAGPCPLGSYCPIGAQLPAPCPQDTYRNVTGAETDTDCWPCPAGSFCPEGRSVLIVAGRLSVSSSFNTGRSVLFDHGGHSSVSLLVCLYLKVGRFDCGCHCLICLYRKVGFV